MSERDAVWVVRDPSRKVIGASAHYGDLAHDETTREELPVGAHVEMMQLLTTRTPLPITVGGYTLTREALTPAPRVVVTDEWKAVLNRDGGIDSFSKSSPEALLEYARLAWPHTGPHRVVRLALVEDAAAAAGVPTTKALHAIRTAGADSKSENALRAEGISYGDYEAGFNAACRIIEKRILALAADAQGVGE